MWLPQLNNVTFKSTLKGHALFVACLFVCMVLYLGNIGYASAQQFIGSGGGKTVPRSSADIRHSFSPVVDAVVPSVVNVYAKRFVRERRRGLFDDPFFKQFFGDEFGSRLAPEESRAQESLGSGVVVDGRGLVVTNHHVIKNAEELTVILSDRREYKARVVVDDERTDLAVLELLSPPEDLQAIVLSDSDNVAVGDLVLAIGNPFGVGQTVTSGIISALARTQVGISDYQSFIQTDAAINPGNSGGALVGTDGRLIGVNTAIFSRSGGSIGIGFAIPANMVGQIIRAAQKGEGIVRPWLGVSLQRVSNDLVAMLGLDRPKGALVTGLHNLSPLKSAGLAVGDVILSVDDNQVESGAALRYQVATRDIGGSINLLILRDARRMTVTANLIPAPEVPPRNTLMIDDQGVLSGAELANINPALIDELRLPLDRTGVMVLSVVRGSSAERLGIRVGDIVKAIGARDITKVADLKALRGKLDRVGSIEILRGDRILRAKLR